MCQLTRVPAPLAGWTSYFEDTMKKKLELHVETLRILQDGQASIVVSGAEFGPTQGGGTCLGTVCVPDVVTGRLSSLV